MQGRLGHFFPGSELLDYFGSISKLVILTPISDLKKTAEMR